MAGLTLSAPDGVKVWRHSAFSKLRFSVAPVDALLTIPEARTRFQHRAASSVLRCFTPARAASAAGARPMHPLLPTAGVQRRGRQGAAGVAVGEEGARRETGPQLLAPHRAGAGPGLPGRLPAPQAVARRQLLVRQRHPPAAGESTGSADVTALLNEMPVLVSSSQYAGVHLPVAQGAQCTW